MKKFNLMKNKEKKKSGIIIMIVLWVLVILSVLAISLGRKTNIELSLSKYYIGKAKAKYLAWAGLIYGIRELQKDKSNPETSQVDTSYYCGIEYNNGITPEELFKRRDLGEGYFTISYKQVDDSSQGIIKSTEIGETYDSNQDMVVNADQTSGSILPKKTFYGMQDEERKININGLNLQNYGVLSNLIEYFGYDKDTADTIAVSVVDWKDADSNIGVDIFGAENDYYESLEYPYKCKNAHFESREEILMVRGVTEEIYKDIKDYITVFPKDNSFKINIDTAARPVLVALCRWMADSMPTTERDDADSLVDKMLAYREGDDGEFFTQDDRIIDATELSTNALERNIFLGINRYRTKRSKYFTLKSTGVDTSRNIVSSISAVVLTDDMSIVSWRSY